MADENKTNEQYQKENAELTALVGMLSTYGAVSAMRIHVLLGSMLGVCLSTGTISSVVAKCAQNVGSTLETIKSMLIGSKVAHFDETGTDENGKTAWVHNSFTSELTYQTIDSKRGQEGMDNNGVLPEFMGIAMHDCWSPYWKYPHVRHAICNAHLLRELTAVEQYSPEHKWALGAPTVHRSHMGMACRLRRTATGKLPLQMTQNFLQ